MKSFIILVELYSPYIPPLYTSWLNAMKTKNGKKHSYYRLHVWLTTCPSQPCFTTRNPLLPRINQGQPCSITLIPIYPKLTIFYHVNPHLPQINHVLPRQPPPTLIQPSSTLLTPISLKLTMFYQINPHLPYVNYVLPREPTSTLSEHVLPR